MKKILHLTVSEKQPGWERELIAAQKRDGSAEVETLRLTADNASEALEKIFAADSICVWPGA